MAEQFDVVTPDIAAPDVPNPYGTFEDEDVSIVGTPILAGWKNSIKAFFERIMNETGKSFSGVPDTVTVSQFFDGFGEMTTGRDPAVADWLAGTFNVNDVTIYKGKQWFVGNDSTINTPGPNSQWEKSKTFDEYLKESGQGPIIGGFLPLNDIRNVTDYNTIFKMGKFEWDNAKWEAWRVNIDGSVHVSGTSDVAKLLALYKHEGKVVASDTAGFLTLKDYQGRVARAVDGAGGQTEDVGDVQEDAFQDFDLEARRTTSPAVGTDTLNQTGTISGGSGFAPTTDFVIIGTNTIINANIADETRVKSWAEGVTGVTILVPEGTI